MSDGKCLFVLPVNDEVFPGFRISDNNILRGNAFEHIFAFRIKLITASVNAFVNQCARLGFIADVALVADVDSLRCPVCTRFSVTAHIGFKK